MIFTEDDERVVRAVALDAHIVRLLQEVCPNDASIAAYLGQVVVERARRWRRGLSELERAGWGRHELLDGAAALQSVPLLEHCDPRELALELRWAGRHQLARRVARQPAVAQALLCVVLELRTGNQACVRAVGLMTPPLAPWWRRLWQRRGAL